MPRRLANKEKDAREQSPAGYSYPAGRLCHPSVTAIKHKREDRVVKPEELIKTIDEAGFPYPTAFSGYRKIM